MANGALGDIEELTLCSCCKRPFDESERAPKLLACQHHFCLSCVRCVLASGGGDVRCVHCWKRTAPPAGRFERLPTHAAVLALVRHLAPCPTPTPASPPPALALESMELRADLSQLAARRRAYLLRVLDATTALKLQLEAELATPPPLSGPALTTPILERDRLRERRDEALRQCRLDELVRDSTAPLHVDTVRQALSGARCGRASGVITGGERRRDPLLLLGNHCTVATCARQWTAPDGSPPGPTPNLRSNAFPLYYFDVEVNGSSCGRVVVEVRSDAAPRMARNFAALATGELGVGYRGCAVFQCWENESVITGDFELNNGRGGRSIFEESYFMPDDTKMAAVRGAVGMRRSQKRHDNLGLVGSQFRIILREMRGFTAIFAFVVEGLELVDRLSRTGDSAGKPQSTILIASCGRLE